MKVVPLLEVLVVNLVLLALFLWVSGDYAYRTAYWRPESLAPSTTRYPFFMITSAAGGSTSIPGLLTVDWQQVVAVALIVADVIYLRSVLRAGKNPSTA